MTNIKKRGRPSGRTQRPIDWETLARNLQEALAKEMKKNEVLESHNLALTKHTYKLEGVIEYLESKRGNDSV